MPPSSGWERIPPSRGFPRVSVWLECASFPADPVSPSPLQVVQVSPRGSGRWTHRVPGRAGRLGGHFPAGGEKERNFQRSRSWWAGNWPQPG